MCISGYSEEYTNLLKTIAEFLIAFCQFMFSQSMVAKRIPMTCDFLSKNGALLFEMLGSPYFRVKTVEIIMFREATSKSGKKKEVCMKTNELKQEN